MIWTLSPQLILDTCKTSVERKNKVKLVYKCNNTRKFVKTIFRLEYRLLFRELKT